MPPPRIRIRKRTAWSTPLALIVLFILLPNPNPNLVSSLPNTPSPRISSANKSSCTSGSERNHGQLVTDILTALYSGDLKTYCQIHQNDPNIKHLCNSMNDILMNVNQDMSEYLTNFVDSCQTRTCNIKGCNLSNKDLRHYLVKKLLVGLTNDDARMLLGMVKELFQSLLSSDTNIEVDKEETLWHKEKPHSHNARNPTIKQKRWLPWPFTSNSETEQSVSGSRVGLNTIGAQHENQGVESSSPTPCVPSSSGCDQSEEDVSHSEDEEVDVERGVNTSGHREHTQQPDSRLTTEQMDRIVGSIEHIVQEEIGASGLRPIINIVYFPDQQSAHQALLQSQHQASTTSPPQLHPPTQQQMTIQPEPKKPRRLIWLFKEAGRLYARSCSSLGLSQRTTITLTYILFVLLASGGIVGFLTSVHGFFALEALTSSLISCSSFCWGTSGCGCLTIIKKEYERLDAVRNAVDGVELERIQTSQRHTRMRNVASFPVIASPDPEFLS